MAPDHRQYPRHCVKPNAAADDALKDTKLPVKEDPAKPKRGKSNGSN